ncbi:MAG TPA: methyltransferase domain-containing protein [Nitrososphaera sp.]|nr:methyltransferase domain-containing protein [Nitrososphaera sp.]
MEYQRIDTASEHPLIIDCQRTLAKQVLQLCNIPFRGKMLDIGPGKGIFTRFFLQLGFEVTCIDVDSTFSDEFRHLGAQFVKADLREGRLPVEDHSFDVIWCSHVIEHVLDTHGFLLECNRVLKQDGYVIIRTPDLKKVQFNFWWDPTHVHPFIRISLERALILAGFQPVLVSNCDLPNLRGLHRVRAYRWLPFLNWMGDNLIGVGVKRGNR